MKRTKKAQAKAAGKAEAAPVEIDHDWNRHLARQVEIMSKGRLICTYEPETMIEEFGIVEKETAGHIFTLHINEDYRGWRDGGIMYLNSSDEKLGDIFHQVPGELKGMAFLCEEIAMEFEEASMKMRRLVRKGAA